jgi:hypothetical protein
VSWALRRDRSPPPIRVLPSVEGPRWWGELPLVGTSVTSMMEPKVS